MHSICQNTLWILISCCLTYAACAILREKVGQKFFITGKNAIFSKVSYFNSLLDPKKSSYKFQSKCQNSLWTLIFCSLMFVTFDSTRKNGTKTFVIVKTALFWNVCFYWPLRCQRIDFIICTKIFKKPCWPFLNVPWHLSHPTIRKKTGQSYFITGKIAFFSSKFSVFPGLLDPKKALIGSTVNVTLACGPL